MSEKHYEMLWDCEYCGMEKLLGVSQRHCPGCGSAQNSEKRYFPSDEDKVEVANHKYMGADKHCSACDTPNAAIAKHCINCGSNMDGETNVKLVSEKTPEPQPPKEEPKKSSSIPILLLIVVVVFGLVCLIGGSCTKESIVQVKGHSWKQSINVEEYAQVKENSWKDELPTKAENVSCTEKERSTKKIPDGEDCKTVKQDKGDGSFIEKQECTPKYKEIPVMDQYCTYRIEKWTAVSPLTSSGTDLNPYPPKGNIKECSITTVGCQKKGSKSETYTVQFQSTEDAGKSYSCDFAQEVWKTYTVGTKFDAQVSLLGALDCASLKEKK